MSLAQPDHAEDDRSTWPYAAMVGFGYFGSSTPEGRRHRNRSLALLLLFLIAFPAAALTSLPWALRVAFAVAIPVSWAAIVWSNIRYVSELDELSRLIQLEAAALSYGVALVIASVWFALAALRVLEPVDGSPSFGGNNVRSMLAMMIPMSIIMAEPLRGVLLVILARSRR